MEPAVARVKQLISGKEFAIGILLLGVSCSLLFVSINPVAWYKSSTTYPCANGDTVKSHFTVTLWRYHSCVANVTSCTAECSNKKWSDLWKIGCGGVGPRGQQLYCYDFDVAGEMTSGFLILALILSCAVFPLGILRYIRVNVKYITEVRVIKAILLLCSFSWACCIISFMWYPYIVDAGTWDEQNDGNIHLAVGWYFLMLCIPVYLAAIVFFIIDFATISKRESYEDADDSFASDTF